MLAPMRRSLFAPAAFAAVGLALLGSAAVHSERARAGAAAAAVEAPVPGQAVAFSATRVVGMALTQTGCGAGNGREAPRALLSDDRGRTWKRGGCLPATSEYRAFEAPPLVPDLRGSDRAAYVGVREIVLRLEERHGRRAAPAPCRPGRGPRRAPRGRRGVRDRVRRGARRRARADRPRRGELGLCCASGRRVHVAPAGRRRRSGRRSQRRRDAQQPRHGQGLHLERRMPLVGSTPGPGRMPGRRGVAEGPRLLRRRARGHGAHPLPAVRDMAQRHAAASSCLRTATRCGASRSTTGTRSGRSTAGRVPLRAPRGCRSTATATRCAGGRRCRGASSRARSPA